jgi:putative ATP-dependent endonuclease of OLD family
MEEVNPGCFYPFDLSGVTVITADGEGSIPEFGAFFKAMQIMAFAFYDKRKRKPEEEQKLKDNFDISCQTAYAGAETLLVEEIPAARLWEFLVDLRDSGEKPTLVLSETMPTTSAVKTLAYSVLEKEKGSVKWTPFVRQPEPRLKV